MGSLQGKVDNLVTSQTADVVGNTETFITQLVNAAQAVTSKSFTSDLPVIGQIVNGVQYIDQTAQDAAAQLKQLYSSYEAAYCTPAVYTPPAPVPANLTGGNLISCAVQHCHSKG